MATHEIRVLQYYWLYQNQSWFIFSSYLVDLYGCIVFLALSLKLDLSFSLYLQHFTDRKELISFSVVVHTYHQILVDATAVLLAGDLTPPNECLRVGKNGQYSHTHTHTHTRTHAHTYNTNVCVLGVGKNGQYNILICMLTGQWFALFLECL